MLAFNHFLQTDYIQCISHPSLNKSVRDVFCYFRIHKPLSYHIVQHYQTLMLASKSLNANVSYCLKEAQGLSNKLFYFENRTMSL